MILYVLVLICCAIWDSGKMQDMYRNHTSCRICVFSFCSLGHGIQLWDCSLCRLLSGMALPLDSGNCQSAFAWSWASPTLGKQRSEWLEKGNVGTKGSSLHARQVPKEAVTWIDLGCWFDCMHLLLLMHQHMRQHVHIYIYIPYMSEMMLRFSDSDHFRSTCRACRNRHMSSTWPQGFALSWLWRSLTRDLFGCENSDSARVMLLWLTLNVDTWLMAYCVCVYSI